MNLEAMIAAAARVRASDLHLEAGLPPAMRVKGQMRIQGDPIPAATLAKVARGLLGTASWKAFTQRGSFDCSRTISGARCRINVLRSSRGVGMAIRLLSSFQPTLERLNLHPELRTLVRGEPGLVLVCGPTGSGKSSTLAALIHEINTTEQFHIVTLESPIEFAFRPRRSYIRQREIGRDTPSFEQGLVDAMREDPDVIMVGEMRDAEIMRLTLSAAETGHLVFSTVHASTTAEALTRMISAFAPETQSGVASQLADCLKGVVSQRLVFRHELGLRLPEIEVLRATSPVRSLVRQNALFKLPSVLETGAADGQWSTRRYKEWMKGRQTWVTPDDTAEPPDSDPAPAGVAAEPSVEPAPAAYDPAPAAETADPSADTPPPEQPDRPGKRDVIVIEPPPGESIGDILSELEED